MKTNRILLIFAALAGLAFGQTALTQTTLSAAITTNQTVIQVASLTGISCSTTQLQPLYIIDPGVSRGELVNCQATSSTGGNFLTVQRGGAYRSGHASGSLVVISSSINYAQSFKQYDPYGTCTATQQLVTPWINTNNGNQWLCSTVTGTWVPSWQNQYLGSAEGSTATVASAAGQITPSGPFFSISGTAAITGFLIPVGFTNGHFCVVPTGAFTTTTANNIAVASTAVAGVVDCWYWNASTSKWQPTY